MAHQAMEPEWAMNLLLEGNERFCSGHLTHPHQQPDRRTAYRDRQNPFAVVVACSDSRVPPEILFDRGIGDLFVIRSAGNVLDDVEIGSIEYAVEHLGVSLVLVLGHSNCGAVHAAVVGGEPEGHIGSIVERIEPAVTEVRSHTNGDTLDEMEVQRENVRQMVKTLEHSGPIFTDRLNTQNLLILGAHYDMDTGRVGAIV